MEFIDFEEYEIILKDNTIICIENEKEICKYSDKIEKIYLVHYSYSEYSKEYIEDTRIIIDKADTEFDDLIYFKEEVLLEDVIKQVDFVKNNIEDYTNEDIYNSLKKLGKFTIQWIGQYEIIEY